VDGLRDGQVQRFECAREVIVCGGTYQSAVLLMVSGIGPAAELAPLGITVRQDLPVGRNLQDHIMTALVHRSDVVSLLGAFPVHRGSADRDALRACIEILEGGSPRLDRMVLDAIRQWRYRPMLINGVPVEVQSTVDVVFTLDQLSAHQEHRVS